MPHEHKKSINLSFALKTWISQALFPGNHCGSLKFLQYPRNHTSNTLKQPSSDFMRGLRRMNERAGTCLSSFRFHTLLSPNIRAHAKSIAPQKFDNNGSAAPKSSDSLSKVIIGMQTGEMDIISIWICSADFRGMQIIVGANRAWNCRSEIGRWQ